MKNKLTQFTKYCLDVMFVIGIVGTISLPLIFKLFGKKGQSYWGYYFPMSIAYSIMGLFAVMILWELRKMFKTVLQEDCFVRDNVSRLKRMGTFSFMIAIVSLSRLFFYITPTLYMEVLVFTVAGLFSKVLAGVFDQAVTYKEENDLTI